ncbi:MAG TPA: hypothetical protein VGM67_09695 [Gemmatimonadaceae bacterium]|jgi:hypothetical protein
MSGPILTETRERFLIAILAQVPAERVAEIHFFSPIKQSGVESGVAVVVERGAEPEAPVDVQEELLPAADTDRYVVHTARYRLTLKGLDRGKWETSIAAEADAPLATVDAVVRGVQRRSGDVDDATRMDAAEVQAFVEQRAAAAGTPAA